jgi:hypothetical protein
MNESLKQEIERFIGDEFVEWLNRKTGSEFRFKRTGANPPDLVYRDGNKMLPVEVTMSYYNENDAIFRFKIARKDPTAPTRSVSFRTNEHQVLIANINKRIAEKCLSKHDPETVLVVGFFPEITTKAVFEAWKNGIVIPKSTPFAAIYVAGTFAGDSYSPGGYFCWKVAKPDLIEDSS